MAAGSAFWAETRWRTEAGPGVGALPDADGEIDRLAMSVILVPFFEAVLGSRPGSAANRP
jgi:hypothetical protein